MLGTAAGGLTVCPAGWLPRRVTRTSVAAALSELLRLDIDLILPAHGDPPPEPRAALAAAVTEAVMIARTWRGATAPRDADAYVAYLEATGLRQYRATPGNRGAYLLRRADG